MDDKSSSRGTTSKVRAEAVLVDVEGFVHPRLLPEGAIQAARFRQAEEGREEPSFFSAPSDDKVELSLVL